MAQTAAHDPAADAGDAEDLDQATTWAPLASIASEVRAGGGTAQESVAEAIRRGILMGLLRPGTRLAQTRVGRRLSVSPTPVREALRGLVTEGLVHSERRRGFVVVELDAEAIEEIYDLRALVECHALRLAVPLLTDEDLVDLRRIHDAMDAAEDWGTRVALRESFYARLYGVTARPRLIALIDRLRNEVGRQMRSRPIRLRRPVHLPILEAAERGDAEEATRVLQDHYREIAQLFRRFARELHVSHPVDGGMPASVNAPGTTTSAGIRPPQVAK